MPFVSQAQRRFMYAKHPELAREFEAATPKGKKLPEHVGVKKAYDAGFADALSRFKVAGEEIRLQIPKREFHGFDAAFKAEGQRGQRKMADAADGDPTPVDALTAALDQIVPPGIAPEDARKDPLDRDAMWSSPSNLAAGDAGNRVSNMGQPTGIGQVF